MNYAGSNKNMKELMWCAAANTATALEGIRVPSWKTNVHMSCFMENHLVV